MRLAGLSAWTSLTCLGAILTVAAGCQVPTPEDEGIDPNAQNQDPSGTNPNVQIPPGSTNYVPNGSSAPAVRKLALDLGGVAGFAILDDDSQDSQQSASSFSAGSASASAGGANPMWLESNGAGQVLVRNVDRVNVDRLNLDRFAAPGTVRGPAGLGSPLPELAEEDPGATPPAPTGDAAAPAPSPTGTTPDTDVGKQAGLLKITEDGKIEPALVALETAPAPTSAPAPGSETTAGTAGDKPAPSDGGSATAPAGGTGGATSGGSSTSEAPAPVAGPVGPQEPMPRVTALGLSPDGSVYVLFEHGFTYRQPTAEEMSTQGFDAYSPQSPLRCQLFRANGSWQGDGAAGQHLAELECVTSQYEVPTWDVRRVMQFDASGKLYFRGMTQNNPQGVFLQFDPTTRRLSEKVNANICWRDVQVTPRGSLFYTGSSGDCSGTSFFRYVSADSRLTEISRNFWNFKYLAEKDPSAPDNERIIFYGPDPNSASTNPWDTACLYRYNPALATAAERTQKLIECYRDGYSYVNGDPQMGPMPPRVALTDEQLAALQLRCESEGQLFISGDSVTSLSQLDDGTLFMVGKFQRKVAGTLGCRIQVSNDHCALLGDGTSNDGLDTVNTTEQACTDAGHHWVITTPGCSNGVDQAPDTCVTDGGVWNFEAGPRYYDLKGEACTISGDGITRNYVSCDAPPQSMNFSTEVNGLAYLVPASGDTPAHLELFSDPTEQVEHYWPVPGPNGAQLFYSVYSAGQYSLRMATQVTGDSGTTIERKALLNDYEVYNLQRDPAHPERVLFDALQFSTNSYLFGSIDPSLPTAEEVQASLQTVDGVSGKVEALIILPNF